MTLPPTTQNLTALQAEIAPAWVSEPNGRGTWSLLYSCTFTLTLCVYTAVHLNIPRSKDSRWVIYGRQVKRTLIAIIAPEVVLYTALHQFTKAVKLWRTLNFYSHSVRALPKIDRSLEIKIKNSDPEPGARDTKIMPVCFPTPT